MEKENSLQTTFKKSLICVIIGLIIWFIPIPNGVNPQAWHLLAIFVATIAGFILQPLSIGAVSIIACTALVIFHVLKAGEALAGFSNTIIWLIVSAFMFAEGFVKTGLGNRIAYQLLAKFGSSSLRVAYVMSVADFMIAPFTPSNTARGGGIIFPIVNSICSAIGAAPNKDTNHRTAAFFMFSSYCAVITSACIFLTGASNNALAATLSNTLFGVTITWTDWFIACIVPGIILSVLTPLLLYKIINPELKYTPETKEMAKEKLTKMGAMSSAEKTLCLIFLSALFLWATGPIHGIDSAFIALLGLSAMLAAHIIDWNDVLNQKGAWDVLIWMGILVNMAAYLAKLGLMNYFAKTVGASLDGISWIITLIVLSVVYVYAHYGLASNSAHIMALFGTFASILIVAGAPALGILIIFGVLANSCSFLTHYGCGVTPIFFGANYISQGKWWKIGFLISTIHIIVWLLIGLPWMKLVGFF
ncbi:DASS family sodium-coupled anion symporter [Pectinatus haikarae]|uniref:DASS family divalent anion:Na+ symporter n=1 Tax=Pectinatus haikarae TaxID=349096 RepID=A0ABT9Y472_9FIRM|nr:DASS family sodium-coupled anion symporter [Pectinatus haikarae]MDQ0202628.1 DASS family divalent anion:Na+ symporter [Pectinatus haikarae]